MIVQGRQSNVSVQRLDLVKYPAKSNNVTVVVMIDGILQLQGKMMHRSVKKLPGTVHVPAIQLG
jgi:hypothetical protein